MSEAIFNRLVAIIEGGTYGTTSPTSLNAHALRTLIGRIDPIAGMTVGIFPRGDTGWERGTDSGFYFTNLLYDLSFYVQNIAEPNQAKGVADAINFNSLALQIFLSRPQLQLSGLADIPEVMGFIDVQTTSNLSLPIPYPPNIAPTQGASLYWGFILRLSIPYQQYIEFKVQG